jgi:hypothetical protein
MSSGSGFDLWVTPVEASQKPTPIVQTRALESLGEWSPSGALLAYMSNESGQRGVYVTRYPGGGERWPVSAAGGTNPHWSRDGKALYFLGETSLLRAPVRVAGRAVEIGDAEAIVPLPFRMQVTFGLSSNLFSVSPDEQRFLFNVPVDDSPSPLKLVVNWPERLRQ